MQIPGVGQFGNDIAAAPQATAVPRLDAGQGAQALGGALEGIGAQEGAIDRQRLIEAAQARTALALAKTSNAVQDAHDQVARGVLDGSIPTDKAGPELQDRIAKARQANLDGLLPEQRQVIDAHLETVASSAARSLTGVVVKRQQNETAATIDQFDEEQQRAAIRSGDLGRAVANYSDMVDVGGPAAGIAPEQREKMKQTFKEKTTFNFFDAKGTAALTAGDVKGVTDTLAQVQGPDGEAMDPLRRIRLEHQLYGYQQHLLAQQQRDANATEQEQRVRDNQAISLFNQGMDLFQAGKAFDPGFIKQLVDTAAGTSSEKDVVSLLSAQQAGTGFATKTQAERDALLARMQSDETTAGTNPTESKAVATLAAMNDKLRAATKDDPWKAASSAGRVPMQQPMNASDPQGALAIMADRMKNIGVVEQWAGAKVSPLMPGEADQVAKLLRVLPPDQAASMMGHFGATIGDSDRIGAFARQLHDKDGTLGLAMAFANTQTTEGRHAAELVLLGDQAVKDGTVKVDGAKETGWKADIATKVRGAYANQEVEDQVVRSAFLMTAALSSHDTDNAIRLATGGGIIDFNGAKVPMPTGFAADGGQSGAEDRFRKAIEHLPVEQLQSQITDGKVYVRGTPMAASDFYRGLPDAQLLMRGRSQSGGYVYGVKAGNTLVTNARGQPVLIEVQ